MKQQATALMTALLLSATAIGDARACGQESKPCGEACWIGDGEQLRHVGSRSIRETWTQYDPELSERERLPKELRRELRK